MSARTWLRRDPHEDWTAIRKAAQHFGEQAAEEIYGHARVAFALATRSGAPDPRPKWTADNRPPSSRARSYWTVHLQCGGTVHGREAAFTALQVLPFVPSYRSRGQRVWSGEDKHGYGVRVECRAAL